jgi:hypothetical protein
VTIPSTQNGPIQPPQVFTKVDHFPHSNGVTHYPHDPTPTQATHPTNTSHTIINCTRISPFPLQPQPSSRIPCTLPHSTLPQNLIASGPPAIPSFKAPAHAIVNLLYLDLGCFSRPQPQHLENTHPQYLD